MPWLTSQSAVSTGRGRGWATPQHVNGGSQALPLPVTLIISCGAVSPWGTRALFSTALRAFRQSWPNSDSTSDKREARWLTDPPETSAPAAWALGSSKALLSSVPTLLLTEQEGCHTPRSPELPGEGQHRPEPSPRARAPSLQGDRAGVLYCRA